MEDNGLNKSAEITIEEEMQKSYLDYAMSVIIGRAIPDVRDGLKPVHRRSLFAMNEMGSKWNKPYKKSARIVGDIIGKYHPHGDSAAYDTIVRMAQDFSMRYRLIDGQGNFGSVDGDPPAAMRYTEVRMERITEELLQELDRETVDFIPNYDESLMEPVVLPARLPMLLLNGGSGIAVGVASNIPPHNISEIIAATVALIKDPAISVTELMRYVQGPDFPTAGFICGREGIISAYKTGRGSIKIRARAVIEKNERTDRESIVITELPYQVNKAVLVEKISELVKERRIEGIADLRDESDRDGIRVVLDLKKDENSTVLLNNLFKHSQLEASYGILMLAIRQGRPCVLNLKEILESFVEFRQEVVVRRTRFDLRKAQERAHILAGLLIALANIDAVIALIKKSTTPAEAMDKLCAGYQLSELQAKAILEMRLQRLTALESGKIQEEFQELSNQINRLQEILQNDNMVKDIIIAELEEIKQRHGDARRTEIVADVGDINIEDLITQEDMVVTVSHQGYIKRNPVSLYRSQRRGGKGKIAMGTKEEDFVEKVFVASTHHFVLIFSDRGRVYWLKVYQIPQAGRAAKGKAIVNLVGMQPGEKIAAVCPVESFAEGKQIIKITKKGIIKKTKLVAFGNPRTKGVIAMSVKDDDALIAAKITNGDQQIFLGTKQGKALLCSEEDVREVGRTASGVIGIRLAQGDEVVGAEIPVRGAYILSISVHGYGKRTSIAEYPLQARGGKGNINIRTSSKVGELSGVLQVTGEGDIILISDKGKIIRVKESDIPVLHRATQGVKLISLEEGERLIGLASCAEEQADDEEGMEN
ncbi:MAG: DNA gyrase subunit A [Deltaproteobacteria bacterium]|nr:DNA gyrase subunit A [Deltaproteobacteria bacterium]